MPPNPRKWKTGKGGSHIWRGIMKCNDILKEAVKWTVGNGRDTSMWEDWWCGNMSFQKKFGNRSDQIYSLKVSDLINQRGE